jgi:hypothetical protein
MASSIAEGRQIAMRVLVIAGRRMSRESLGVFGGKPDLLKVWSFGEDASSVLSLLSG